MENSVGSGNNFYMSVPKKQAKSYEIDLGQNNGAYKEELLIRYGDNTLNQMMNKKNRVNNLNMEDIMRMNEQLRPFQERPKVEGIVSFAQICDGIEDKIGKMEDNSKVLTESEVKFNSSIETMTNEVIFFNDKVYNEFNPELLDKYNYLKSKIKEQKDENANLLKQIDLLLQENSLIMDLVIKVGSRLDVLEKKAGVETKQKHEIEEKEQEMNENQSSHMAESDAEYENEQNSEIQSNSRSNANNSSVNA